MSTPSEGAPTDPPSRPPSASAPGQLPNPTTLMVSNSTLLARGIGLLLISFILVVVVAGLGDGDVRTRIVLGWAEQAAFWLGMVCIAGDVLGQVLGRKR